MIDFKKTIINLHKAFPDKDLDELMKIIECIEESVNFNPLPGNPIPREPFKNPYGPPQTVSPDTSSKIMEIMYSD